VIKEIILKIRKESLFLKHKTHDINNNMLTMGINIQLKKKNESFKFVNRGKSQTKKTNDEYNIRIIENENIAIRFLFNIIIYLQN